MIIELEEYELPKGKAITDGKAYPNTGLFYVKEFEVYHIVHVYDVSQPTVIIHVPLDIIERVVRKESAKDTEKDIVGQMRGRLDEISDKLDDLLENKQIDSVPQIYTQEKIDGNTLLKAIALVQNPELAKDLLIDN